MKWARSPKLDLSAVQGVVAVSIGTRPDRAQKMVWLYRRPIPRLLGRARRRDMGAIITHVLVRARPPFRSLR